MERIVKYITEKLQKNGIQKSYEDDIKAYMDDGVIDKQMALNSAYSAFLLKKGSQNGIFVSILEGKTLCDISFNIAVTDIRIEKDVLSVEETVENKLKDLLDDRAEYVYVEEQSNNDKQANILNVKIRLSKNAYKHAPNVNLPSYILPYYIMSGNNKLFDIDQVAFQESLFVAPQENNVQTIYAELIQHLQQLDLPLSIVDDNLLYAHTGTLPVYECQIFLQESSQWPSDQDAVDCAKTAFYCQMYLKSKYRHCVNKNYVTFKYKEFYFKASICLRREITMKNRVTIELMRVIKNLGKNFHDGVRSVKQLLGHLGFYPMLLNDLHVDVICVMINRESIGMAKFTKNFLKAGFEFSDFSLDTLTHTDLTARRRPNEFKLTHNGDVYNIILPCHKIIKDTLSSILSKFENNSIRMFDSNFNLKPVEDFIAEPIEYDFILSRVSGEGFEEIVGAPSSDFALGTPDYTSLEFIKKDASIFFCPYKEELKVIVREGVDIDLIANIIITETSFNYIKFTAY